MTSSWLTLCIIVLFVHSIHGFPDGPPVSACTDMQPGTQVGTTGMEGHVAGPRNLLPGRQAIAPYYIHIYKENLQYGSNEEISVSIMANQTHQLHYYKGVLMQAHKVICSSGKTTQAEHEPLGTFTVDSYSQKTLLRTMACNGRQGSAVSHKSRQMKINETAVWRSGHVGHVVFHATIVQDTAIYWKDVFSPILQQPGIDPPPACTASLPQLTTTCLLLLVAAILRYY